MHFIPTQWRSAGEARRNEGVVLSRSNSAIKWPERTQPLVLFVSRPILVLIMKLKLSLWALFGQDRVQALDISWMNDHQFDLKDGNCLHLDYWREILNSLHESKGQWFKDSLMTIIILFCPIIFSQSAVIALNHHFSNALSELVSFFLCGK